MARSINIRFPIKESFDGGVFESTQTSEMAWQSDLISFLTTKKGQRPMRSDLYSPIYDYIMEPLDDITEQELKRDIDVKVRKFIPQIEIKKVILTPIPEQNALKLKIIYLIKDYFNIEKSIELIYPTSYQQ